MRASTHIGIMTLHAQRPCCIHHLMCFFLSVCLYTEPAVSGCETRVQPYRPACPLLSMMQSQRKVVLHVAAAI